jgi:hypothetical protein
MAKMCKPLSVNPPGTGKVVRQAGAHDRAVFTTGKHYDADLNAAYNIASRYWVRRLTRKAAARRHLAALLGWDDEAKAPGNRLGDGLAKAWEDPVRSSNRHPLIWRLAQASKMST